MFNAIDDFHEKNVSSSKISNKNIEKNDEDSFNISILLHTKEKIYLFLFLLSPLQIINNHIKDS